jgi:Major Facilitator Superfamily
MAALTKPLFPLASSVGVLLVARFVDRIGKGIRGAPRDALIGDVTPVEFRGTAFGLRQAMDTVGAFIGPLLAMLLMAVSNDNFRLVFWIAVIPAAISVCVVLYGVQEPDAPRTAERRPFPIQRAELARLDGAFWWLVGIASILTLGRFSEAFLLLSAAHVGLAVANAARARGDVADSRRHRVGDRRDSMAGLCRRGALGPPHGGDTGLALDSCGRCGSRRSAGPAADSLPARRQPMLLESNPHLRRQTMLDEKQLPARFENLAISDTAYEGGIRRLEREMADKSAPQVRADHLCLLTIRGDRGGDG